MEKKIVDYSFLYAQDSAVFNMVLDMRKEIKSGWTPYGNQLIAGNNILQAIVKYED